MTEVWKDIEGYEGLYQVSNLGRIRSLDRIDSNGRKRRGKIIKPLNVGKGYVCVGLHLDGLLTQRYVHRLVALAFVDGYDDEKEVNHINEDKHDNRAVNLEWIGRKENINHGTGRQRQRENLRTKKAVIMLSENDEALAEFDSMRAAERETHARHDHISQCCQGNPLYKTVAGYKWRLKK